MKTIVSIDRSTAQGSFAITVDGATAVLKNFTESLPRSPEWFPALAGELERAGIGCAAIDAYAVGVGPGSFSGIRAVLAAVQGLALPFGIPVLGYLSSSAAAYAAFLSRGRQKVTVAGDARRGMLWIDSYDFSNPAEAISAARPALIPHGDAPAALARGGEGIVISPDRDRVAAAIVAAGGGEADIEVSIPTAEDVARLCMDFPGLGRRDPVPAYLHPAVQPVK